MLACGQPGLLRVCFGSVPQSSFYASYLGEWLLWDSRLGLGGGLQGLHDLGKGAARALTNDRGNKQHTQAK